MGKSVLIMAASAQDSLICLPYTTDRARAEPDDPERLGGALTQSLLSVLFAALVVLATTTLLSVNDRAPQAGGLIWVGLALPFMLLREFSVNARSNFPRSAI